jgi:hypothetical protein
VYFGSELPLGGAKINYAQLGKSLASCQELIMYQMCQAATGGNNPPKNPFLRNAPVLALCSFFSTTSSQTCVFEAKPFLTLSFTPPPHRFLHLAIIHEATEHAEQMIKLSHNDDLFLDAQNNQRQVIKDNQLIFV